MKIWIHNLLCMLVLAYKKRDGCKFLTLLPIADFLLYVLTGPVFWCQLGSLVFDRSKKALDFLCRLWYICISSVSAHFLFNWQDRLDQSLRRKTWMHVLNWNTESFKQGVVYLFPATFWTLSGYNPVLQGFIAGGFIYMSVGGVMPSMHDQGSSFISTLSQLVPMVLGMGVAVVISLAEWVPCLMRGHLAQINYEDGLNCCQKLQYLESHCWMLNVGFQYLGKLIHWDRTW